MTVLRTGTWLGDAAEVIDALNVDSDEDIQRIASMLGLEFTGRQVTPTASATEAEPAADRVPDGPPPPAASTIGDPGDSRLCSLSPLALPRLEPVDVQPLRGSGAEAPAMPEQARGQAPPELPFRPMLRPRTAAGVVAAAVRTWGPGSRIDERRTVAELARGRPISEIPRRPRLSVHRGVLLLVDLGEALDPYGRDQQHVVDLVRRVVGPEMTIVGNFEHCPSRGVRIPRRAAARGRPVLALTDLGLGGPRVQPARASAAEWYRYARGIVRAGSQVVALVPYRPERADRTVSREIAVVPWDRASISVVQHARRRAS